MIVKIRDKFSLCCDKCKKKINFRKFQTAVKYAQQRNYKIKINNNGEYESLCLKCQGKNHD